MPKRGRELDEFPQQLQDDFVCSTVDGGIGSANASLITQTEWRMPVELDLNHPIFLECSKLHCQQGVGGDNPAAATVVAGASAFHLVREVKVMKEARGVTTWPADSDRATLATFRLQAHFEGVTNIAVGLTYMDYDKWQFFEDSRTGYGELIAQPRLFVLTRTVVNSGGLVNPAAIAAKNVTLSMHYRLTNRIQGKEYLTELIAKFT